MNHLPHLLFGLATLGAAPAEPPSQDIETLTRQLSDSDKWKRRNAVAALGKMDEDEAWKLVVSALGDPAGEVADTAEWYTGQLSSQELIDHVHGREGLGSKDRLVRLRSAGALGRVAGSVDGKALLSLVAKRDPALQRAALQAIEAQARSGRLDGDVKSKVEKAFKSGPDPRVRGDALRALSATSPEAGREAAIEALADDAPPVRAAAVGLDVPADAVVEALADEHVAVRVAAVNALADIGTAHACRALAARIESEECLRIQWRIVERLQALSGLAHRRDPRPWRDWAGGLEEGWEPPPPPGSSSATKDDRTAALAGLPILSERVTFLIDMSGSMWKTTSDGKTRKQVVDVRLRECLEKLPESTRFNLIPYNADPIPWKKELQQATTRSVSRALGWFESRRDRGTGDFWDAFELALTDPDVDTIVMLGDGAPTGGLRYHFSLLPELIERETRTQGVAMDAILVTGSKKAKDAWAQICLRTGGRLVTADF